MGPEAEADRLTLYKAGSSSGHEIFRIRSKDTLSGSINHFTRNWLSAWESW